ncbi:serine/threonine protein kinase [Nocardia yamanashiensis]|uniref:serine/threonine-protein kinase n=1 Tax=Nocardia yamanashiensis TaxID=209247 RepID=UPI001E319D96|nr:serine/threonine-protein kinase [Nocardia yamanashiensis]UGT44650.1 serine/threonine protein kinase [Nocardia yamanashiensis]
MSGQLRPGVVFADYRIVRLLGSGGMGEVYSAHDHNLPRLVALKVLNRRAAADEVMRRRFQREANTIARLSHPHIVPIFARGEEDGQLWIAMAHIDGSDLAGQIARGPMDPRRALTIIADVAAALDHAHDRGVLHRDVKPANILLTAKPREWALLTDFGIATSMHDRRGLTETGQFLASFRYSAPERFRRESELDRRTDVYSFGCTVFEMLTGRPPFHGEDPLQLIYSHLEEPPPAPSALRPDLPPALDPVLARAMAKQPADRFATCAEFSDAVAAALGAQRATKAGRRTPIARLGRGVRTGTRWRGPAVLAVAGLLITAGVTVALVGMPFAEDNARPPATTGPSMLYCPQHRGPEVLSGTGPGSTASGPDVVLAFQYAYYTLRSGAAAREVVAEDATNISPAEKIQSAIDVMPEGTQYCVQITPVSGSTDRWTARVTEQRPDSLPETYWQTVTTRTVGDRTLITRIDAN